LTEQDSSDNDLDRDDEDDDADQRGRRNDREDEDEDMEPTPRAKPSQKRRAIQDDEEDEEEADTAGVRYGDRGSKDQLKAVMRAVEGNGGETGTENEVDELSDISGDEGDRNLAGQPPTKRLRRGGGGPSLNGSIISSSTANGHFSRANSPTNSLSDPEEDQITVRATAKRPQQQEQSEKPVKLEEALSDAENSDAPVPKKVTTAKGKGRGGGTKGRGRGGATKKGTASTSQPRHRSLSPSARSDSPLSVVSSSDGAALQQVSRETEDGGSDSGRSESRKYRPGKPALDYATGRSARGRGRGKGRYRVSRKSKGTLSAPSISRSDSVSNIFLLRPITSHRSLSKSLHRIDRLLALLIFTTISPSSMAIRLKRPIFPNLLVSSNSTLLNLLDWPINSTKSPKLKLNHHLLSNKSRSTGS